MARYAYTNVLRDENGAVISGATVSVYLADGVTAADVYAAESGGAAVNSVDSDATGRFTFYVDDSTYGYNQEFKIVATKTGYTTLTIDDVKVYGVTAAQAALAAVTPAANKLPYFTSGTAADVADLSAFGRSLIDDANAAAALSTLSITAAAQTILDDASTAAIRTTLGVGTADLPHFGAVICDGVTTLLDGSSRADAQFEARSPVAGGHALISIFQRVDPGDTSAEGAISFQAYDSASAIQQVGSISAMWSDAATEKHGVLRFNVNGDTAPIVLRLFGNDKGAEFFGNSDSVPPGKMVIKTTRESGAASIVGNPDLVIDSNYGGAADSVHLNAYNAGNVLLVGGGGKVGVKKASPGYLIDCEASGGGYYSASDHQWHNGSSKRWKTNVKNIVTGLEIVNGLRPVWFTWDKERGGSKGLGFIAEEVNEVLPEVVSMSKDAPGYADGMSYGAVTAVLVAAVQELTERVKKLEGELAKKKK